MKKSKLGLLVSIAMGGVVDGAVEKIEGEEDGFASFMDSLIDGTDGDDIEEITEGEAAENAEAEVEGEGEGEGESGAGAEAEAEPVVKPVVTEEPIPEPVVRKELTAEERAEIETRRTAAYADLVREFDVSEDHANMLLTAPEKVLPELLAKVYHKAMTDSMAMINHRINSTVSQLPDYLSSINNSKTVEEEATNEFYTINPSLKEHTATVSSLLQPDSTGFSPLVSQAKAILLANGNATPTRADVMGVVGRAIEGLIGLQKAPPVPQKRVVRSSATHQPVAPGAATIPVSGDSNVSKNETYISELLLEQ